MKNSKSTISLFRKCVKEKFLTASLRLVGPRGGRARWLFFSKLKNYVSKGKLHFQIGSILLCSSWCTDQLVFSKHSIYYSMMLGLTCCSNSIFSSLEKIRWKNIFFFVCGFMLKIRYNLTNFQSTQLLKVFFGRSIFLHCVGKDHNTILLQEANSFGKSIWVAF